MPDGHQERWESALGQAIVSFQPRYVRDRHKKILKEKQHRAVEPGRRNTDDCERVLVELNGTAKHARIALKVAMPIRVIEHDVRSAVRTVLVGGVKETAKIRLNAEYIEIISAHFIDKSAGRIAARIQPCLRVVISRQTVKTVVVVAQVEVVGIRELQ